MCGILGAYKTRIDGQLFKNCLDRIRHRGPDGEGIWRSDDSLCTLGHRRLAILDLSNAGKQPMISSNGRYVITFNGEIYNYIELKKELIEKGYRFYSNCDTEVVLAAYEEWGINCQNKFNGMWAFAIYDNVDKILFLSRDRFGVKPMYYACDDNGVVFSSEMKSIIPMLKKATPNKRILGHKTKIIRYEYTDECLITEIKRLPAGSCAIISDNVVRPKKWWNTLEHLIQTPKNYTEQCEMFREIFFDSCKIRMRSDVAIGTALSGGLDSSATICSMAYIIKNRNDGTANPDNQHAFVAKFPGTMLDESYYADKVTEKLNIKSTAIFIDPVTGLNNMPDYIYNFEDVYYTSPVPMMQTYQSLRKNKVLVTLDGHGADELWGGYASDLLYALLDEGTNNGKDEIIETYKKCFDSKVNNTINSKTSLNIQNKFRLEYIIRKVLGLNADKNYNCEKGFNELSHFNKVLYNDFHVTILPTLLRNYDHYSMANSVEIRMPFMDYRLVTMAFSLKWRSKLRGGYTKAIIRDALRDVMPYEVVNRRTKIGFNTPIVEWMKGPWKEFLMDSVCSKEFISCNLIHSRMVRKEIENLINSDNTNYRQAEIAWTHFMPFLWEKYFYKRAINEQV